MQNDARRVAALTALAEAGVPVDVQEFLLRNNALDKAIAAVLSTDAEPVTTASTVAVWAMTDLEKGRYYESVNFGLVEYLGRDVFHGQTTAKFETGRRDICRFQYILPEKLGDFLKPKAPAAQVPDVARWQPPQACDGKEQLAFEAWAVSQQYDMHEHPLHYIFMDPKTSAARLGWNAALRYVRDQFAASPAPNEGNAG